MDNETKTSNNETKEVKFIGTVVRCTYDSEDYKIYAFNVNKEKYPDIKQNKYKNVSVLGELPTLTLGVNYEITATEQESKYGYGYKVSYIKRDVPKNVEDMYLFLKEILTANQAEILWTHYPDIVQRVKENRLDDIDLNKLKGIKEKTFAVIVKKITENFCLADLVIEFKGYLSLSIVKKIFKKYSSIEKLKERLKQNPYKCLCGLAGIGFKTADAILLDMEKMSKGNIENGEPPLIEFEDDLKTSSQRCLSCLIYLLTENENNGHTKMNLANLRSSCLKLVPSCAEHFAEAVKSPVIYYNKETMDCALASTYRTEKYIANKLLTALKPEYQKKWDFDIEKYREVDSVQLSNEQMNTLYNVCNYDVSILMGFAGSGKSFSTISLIKMLNDNNKSFMLLAPTGKASKVLSSYTKYTASTIHRGLGYTPPDNWGYNKEKPLHYDVVIVDEFSMVDIFLFKHLLEAINFRYTKLLLIGDNAQLPSVSCGNLLHDFMTSKQIPITTLTNIFRYQEGGLMKIATDVRNCKPYLDNSMKAQLTVFGSNKDYMFVDVSPQLIPKNAVALYKKLLKNGNSIHDIQVITAKNIGDCGANILNNMIQQVANPNFGKSVSIQIGETTYYEGDLVIQKVNNYNAEIFIDGINTDNFEELEFFDKDNPEEAFVANGETGVITDIYDTYLVINFDGIKVKYYRNDMRNVGLGYCITVHKSQGSSIDNLIVCTPQSHTFMLNSNLIYTALTRMRKKCYHLGTISTVNTSVKKKANLTRNTFMQELLTSKE